MSQDTDLGLRGGSKLHDLLGLFSGYSHGKLGELARHARAYAVENGIEAAFKSLTSTSSLRISFHPGEQDIIVSSQGGYIVLDARTQLAGPGYHAFVVGFVDYLNRTHGWVWNFASAIQHFGDDTGYFSDRDFAALQRSMAQAFTTLSRSLLDSGDGPYDLCPMAINIDTPAFALTTLGPRDRAFFEDPEPEQFYPWWREGVTAETVRTMALCRMWLETLWRVPDMTGEVTDLTDLKRLLDRAIAMGARFAPHEGADDVAALLRGEPLTKADDVTCVGYARHPMRCILGQGWSLAVSSNYQQDFSSERVTCSFLSDDREVHVTLGYEPDSETLTWPKADVGEEYARYQTEHSWAILSTYSWVQDGQRLWVWQGMYQSHVGWAQISAVSASEDDQAWADKILRSVQADGYADSPVVDNIDQEGDGDSGLY